jgi:2'-5' RNA ligase
MNKREIAVFGRVWKEFLGLDKTLATEDKDYSCWHRGRKNFAVWAIDIRNSEVEARFKKARECMAEFLYEPYLRQPHITLLVCGFLRKTAEFSDDYSSDRQSIHIQNLKQAKIKPFKIGIGGLNSFAAAPFLEVADVEGGLEKIRRILKASDREPSSWEYVPHLTTGLYAGAFNTNQVAQKTADLRQSPLIYHIVYKIRLLTYSSFTIAGPLTKQSEVNLTTF